MTLMQDVRATIPDLREAMPDLRAAMPDLRELTTGLRDVVPDARAAMMPSIREGIADLRADLPGPWRKERPSLIGRAAIGIVAALAVAAVAWGVMALLERRRLEAARIRAMEEERLAVSRAEGEGMGTAIAAPAMRSKTTANETMTLPRAGQSSTSPTSGVIRNESSPMVGAHAGPVEGGDPDGR